jgi:hypothetical protein
MARVALPEVNTSGVYAFLASQEEAEFRTWQANVSRTHADGAPYPRRRILDNLRAGRTVNVPAYSLPKWAKQSSAAGPIPQRAIVRPNDTTTFTDDDAMRLWLEENDL